MTPSKPVTPKPISSSTAVVPQSSISPTPAVKTNSTDIFIILLPIGVVILLFVLTLIVIIPMVFLRQSIQRRKTAASPSVAPSLNIEPVEYDVLLSVRSATTLPTNYINDSVIHDQSRSTTVIAYDTLTFSNHDLNENEMIHTIEQNQSSSSLLSITAACSEQMSDTATQDIFVQQNVAYGVRI